MHDPRAMRPIERIGDLDRVLKRLFERERAFRESIGKRLTVDVLHHEVVGLIVMPDIVNRADMRMIQRRNDLRLTLEALLKRWIGGEMCRENFDRDGSIQAMVDRFIDLAHAAAADQRNDFVRTESGAW
jgi:hypothetical protein